MVSEGNGQLLLFADGENKQATLPILAIERTETHPSFWTAPHEVATEDGVLPRSAPRSPPISPDLLR